MKLPSVPPVSDRGRCGSGYVESPRSVDVAAQLLLDVIYAEAIYRRAGRAFIDAAVDIDRDALVRRTAELLRERMRNKPPLRLAEKIIWLDLKNIFGWTSVAERQPEDSA